MKSLVELSEIRNRMKKQLNLSNDSGTENSIRVVVGMATCGIAAGARAVLNAFSDDVAKRKLSNVVIKQVGCIGVCRLEPIVEIYVPGQEKVTYINVNPSMVAKIVSDHIVNKNVVADFTIGTAE